MSVIVVTQIEIKTLSVSFIKITPLETPFRAVLEK
jgi:hypothetical protein